MRNILVIAFVAIFLQSCGKTNREQVFEIILEDKIKEIEILNNIQKLSKEEKVYTYVDSIKRSYKDEMLEVRGRVGTLSKWYRSDLKDSREKIDQCIKLCEYE